MMSEADQSQPLEIVFLPFPTPGHMLPMFDLANIFATFHGVHSTVITTAANATLFRAAGDRVTTRVLEFPAAAVGLPPGVENYGAVTSPDMRPKLFQAISMLRNATEDLIQQISPDCIVSDMYYPWSSDFADEIGVPRFVFHSSSVFSLCCSHSVKANAPHRHVDSDDGVVTLPSLPNEVSLLKSQLPEWERAQTGYTFLIDMVREAERKSHGIVANTLREVEAAYVDHYSSVTGLKVWPIGPVSLWTGDDDLTKAQRGRTNVPESWAACLEWLDQKQPNSVLYVSFGSLTQFPSQQLMEIAAGLEESGQNFLWVPRANNNNNAVEWLPEGFLERMREKKQGFIIEDWAPQLLILGHKSIGGMVTHCGWNSILEGINAGLPLVTWPLFAEQFYNERLVVDVLQIGVAVGVTTWCNIDQMGQKEVVGREKVAAAAKAVMGEGEGEAAESVADMRRRVAELRAAAEEAVKAEGGSSHASLVAFMEELKAKRKSKFGQGIRHFKI